MSSETQVLLSGALTFGAPLALAVCELFILRRRPSSDDSGPPAPPPKPIGPKPLPDCLIPKPIVRARELEDA